LGKWYPTAHREGFEAAIAARTGPGGCRGDREASPSQPPSSAATRSAASPGELRWPAYVQNSRTGCEPPSTALHQARMSHERNIASNRRSLHTHRASTGDSPAAVVVMLGTTCDRPRDLPIRDSANLAPGRSDRLRSARRCDGCLSMHHSCVHAAEPTCSRCMRAISSTTRRNFRGAASALPSPAPAADDRSAPHSSVTPEHREG
jgi:hypothetical protein